MRNGIVVFVVLILIIISMNGVLMPASACYTPIVRIITVTIDQDGIVIWDLLDTSDPFIYDGITYVPIQSIAEQFQIQLLHQENDNEICVSDLEDNTLIMQIHSYSELFDERKTSMQNPAILENDRVLVPIRYVMESFGFSVSWKRNSSNTIHRIWLSEVEFLKHDDVVATSFYVELDIMNAPSGYVFHELADFGETSRGIRLADSVDMVISAYGPAHKINYTNGALSAMSYYPETDPTEESDFYIVFEIEDDSVTNVIISSYL